MISERYKLNLSDLKIEKKYFRKKKLELNLLWQVSIMPAYSLILSLSRIR